MSKWIKVASNKLSEWDPINEIKDPKEKIKYINRKRQTDLKWTLKIDRMQPTKIKKKYSKTSSGEEDI